VKAASKGRSAEAIDDVATDAGSPGRRSNVGLPYFLVDRLPDRGPFELTGAEGRHAATVRRLRTGESLVLTDGRGGVATATVTEVGRGELSVQVDQVERHHPPAVRVTLVQAIPKGDRGELAVELATEAGVDAVVPWAAQRCVVRWTPDRAAHGVEKWRSAARAATKQSRRSFVPPVGELASTGDVVALVGRGGVALVLDDAASSALRTVQLPDFGDVVLIVGPEGGLTEEELTVFQTAGAVPVRLGPQVLRTSTAGAVALGALGVLTGRWT
jgi:16S rRNA (uracil1498-N3)-methyltransferase